MSENLNMDFIFLAGSGLFLFSIVLSKFFSRFGLPSLLLFLAIGMLAGSEGLGGIHFDNILLAKSLGVVALVYILFSGGLDTDWQTVRPVVWPALTLSLLGTLTTATFIGFFTVYVLKFSLLEGFLLGAVVSSTDAAAVFSILRSRSISLKKRLKPLLEFESGSNDPMAVFMTMGIISIIESPQFDAASLGWFFAKQMILGALAGFVMSRIITAVINRLNLEYEGLYPVLTTSLVLFTYALASFFDGNGFLAVYLAGLLLSKRSFFYKKNLLRFHDGLAWLMQIAMFLTLGLLVFPSQLIPVIIPGILVSLFLMFIARPLSIHLCLLPFKFSMNEKHMISWVGLRGAAPIILATFVLMADTPNALTIFNIVFFVVITSVLLQGTTLSRVAKLLKVDAPLQQKRHYPIEFEQREGIDAELIELMVPYNGEAVGKPIYELNLPPDCLITLVCRNEKFVMASGKTVLEGGDVLLALVNKESLKKLQEILNKVKQEDGDRPSATGT